MSSLRQLVAGISLLGPGFDCRLVYVGFVVVRVGPGQAVVNKYNKSILSEYFGFPASVSFPQSSISMFTGSI